MLARSQQIESALTGRIYDPYIRLLLWEGVRTWWRTSLPGWFTCAPSSSSSALAPSAAPFHPAQLVLGASPAKATVCPVTWATETHRTTCAMGFPDGYDEHGAPVEAGGRSEFYRRIRGASASSLLSSCSSCLRARCGLFAEVLAALTLVPSSAVPPADSLTVERLLTQAGLRLAAALNTVLGSAAAAAAEEAGFDGRVREGVLNLGWLEEVEREVW